MFIRKSKLIKELEQDIQRNYQYKKYSKGTNYSAFYLGREIALREIIERLKDGKEINCERTTYIIN